MYVRKSEHSCGGLLMSSLGSIHSNKEGSARYDDNYECVWNIQIPFGYHINFTFTDRFDIETSDNCDKDYLLFEEQSDVENYNSWTQIGKYCGHEKPKPFKSKTNIVRVTFHSNENINGDGFTLNYQMSCGEVFTGSSGVFTSPNYPDNYMGSSRCEFIIQRDPKDFILLEFDDDFNIEEHSTCLWDSVDIYLGNTTSSTHLGPYCSANTKPPPVSSISAILVTFRSDYSVNAKGFRARWTVTSCGGNLTQPFGEIHNPLYLNERQERTYASYLDCVWLMTVEHNRAIELKFLQLDIYVCWMCSCGYIEIRDGNNSSSPLIGKYCHQTETGTIVKSSGNQLWVRFRSNGYQTKTGFKVGYRTTLGEAQGCGGVKYNVTNGVIESPDINNDGNYETDLNCLWSFIMPEDQVVKLTFMKMDLEESLSNMTKCSYDYIEARDGLSPNSPRIDRYCGTTIPSPIIASSNQMVLQFYSDSKQTKTGFKVKFEAINRICGGFVNVTNVTQNLQSINYPNTYPSSLRCKYHFLTKYGYWYQTIQIKFNDFDIDCNNNDFIEFYADTHSTSRIQPFRICGQKAPPFIVSKSGLWMTLVTNSTSATNHRGFSLNYTYSICNQTYSEDSGIIINQNYPSYTWYPFCRINITAPVGYTISLYFRDFAMAYRTYDQEDCLRSNMTVKDGVESSSRIIRSFCGPALPDPIFSTGNQLAIEIRNTWYSSKFSISYTTTDAGPGCGGNLTALNGTFTSPLYPIPYNVSKECKWIIHSFGLHSLTLSFTRFSLSSTIGCQSNYVEIYEGSEELLSSRVIRLCGDDTPASYQSQGNVLMVKLVTNTSNNGTGFRANYNYNSLELNATKAIMTANLSPHISSDGSVYFPSDGVLFRHN